MLHSPCARLASAVLVGFLLLAGPVRAEPWPLEKVASIVEISEREGLQISPDGQWLAYTVVLPDTVRQFGGYSERGVYLGSGANRRQARVTHLASGETIDLGANKAFSWGPSWSPNGREIAFFSDQEGRAGLHIWNLDRRTSRLIPGVTPRVQFYFETPRWHPDGKRVAILSLPAGAALVPEKSEAPRVVEVQVSGVPEKDSVVSWWSTKQLAVVDLSDDSVVLVGEPRYIRHYGFSPDGRRLAYCYFRKNVPNSKEQLFELRSADLGTRLDVVIGDNLRLRYGTEWTWSPDAKRIAYLTSQAAGGRIGILFPEAERPGWQTEGEPNLDWSDGERAPLWDPESKSVYGCDGKSAYTLDISSRKIRTVASVPGWKFRGFFSPLESSRGWQAGSPGWLLASGPEGQTGFWKLSSPTGKLSLEKTIPARISSAPYRTISSPDGRRLIYFATSSKNPGTVNTYDVERGTLAKAIEPNPFLKPGFFGERKILEWKTKDGRSLKGVLLLPPGYQGGPLPTVFWVYGGNQGTDSNDRFGMGYDPVFNFEILASRGYAVFEPEIPIRLGQPMKDIGGAVLSAADALVEQGYSDPERLAVMGQSYGSYTVLCLLVQTQRFKAAVMTAAVGHPDLFAAYAGDPGYFLDSQGNMGVKPWENPDLYRLNSPYFSFDRIVTPILIGQGTEDNVQVSKDIFSALQSLDKSIELRLYDKEGHVISEPANVTDFWQRRLEFLDLHLRRSGRVGLSSCLEGRGRESWNRFLVLRLASLPAAEEDKAETADPEEQRQNGKNKNATSHSGASIVVSAHGPVIGRKAGDAEGGGQARHSSPTSCQQ